MNRVNDEQYIYLLKLRKVIRHRQGKIKRIGELEEIINLKESEVFLYKILEKRSYNDTERKQILEIIDNWNFLIKKYEEKYI